jgi:hypothetical protein
MAAKAAPKSKRKAPKKPNAISKKALADQKGVTRGAVTRACYPGGALELALLPGGRVDLDHAATQAWLAGSTKDASKPARAPQLRLEDGSYNLDELGHFTLTEIVEQYGSVTGFIDFVEARKKIADTRRVELQNAETEGHLISRELVKTHVFGVIDAVTRRLLSDVCKNLTRRAYSMALSGAPIEEAQRVASELITATLAPMTKSAARTLRKHEPDQG